MAVLPFSPTPWLNQQFFDNDGLPLAGGFVTFYEAGSFSVKKDTYSSADSSTPVANTNPIELDAHGRATIFIAPDGYNVKVQDTNLVTLYTLSLIEDVGATFSAEFGNVIATGQRNATAGYTITANDNFITANGTPINLPASATRSQTIGIKNVTGSPVAVTPSGVETIDTVTGAFSLAAAASPIFPTLWLAPDPESGSGWLIVASHGL